MIAAGRIRCPVGQRLRVSFSGDLAVELHVFVFLQSDRLLGVQLRVTLVVERQIVHTHLHVRSEALGILGLQCFQHPLLHDADFVPIAALDLDLVGLAIVHDGHPQSHCIYRGG